MVLITCSWVSTVFLLLLEAFFMCSSVATSGWVGGRSYTLGSSTLASSPPPNDIAPASWQGSAFVLIWPSTVDVLGRCETASLCVRSLEGHLSARVCSVVASLLAVEAVFEWEELLPPFLLTDCRSFASDPNAPEVLLNGELDKGWRALTPWSLLYVSLSLLVLVQAAANSKTPAAEVCGSGQDTLSEVAAPSLPWRKL